MIYQDWCLLAMFASTLMLFMSVHMANKRAEMWKKEAHDCLNKLIKSTLEKE